MLARVDIESSELFWSEINLRPEILFQRYDNRIKARNATKKWKPCGKEKGTAE
jgi:hypothetical protein